MDTVSGHPGDLLLLQMHMRSHSLTHPKGSWCVVVGVSVPTWVWFFGPRMQRPPGRNIDPSTHWLETFLIYNRTSIRPTSVLGTVGPTPRWFSDLRMWDGSTTQPHVYHIDPNCMTTCV